MSEFALSLQRVFSPIDSDGLLFGAAVGFSKPFTDAGRRRLMSKDLRARCAASLKTGRPLIQEIISGV